MGSMLERAVLGEKGLGGGGVPAPGGLYTTCAAGTWWKQGRWTGGWWPSHWVPSCEQSGRGRQRREEAPCLQLREPWYVPHTETEAWGSQVCQGELACW